MLKHKVSQVFCYVILFCSVLFVLVPLWMMITGSLMGEDEVTHKIGAVLEVTQKPVSWTLLPDFPTLQPCVQLLLDSPKFFVMFWNSVKQVVPIILGQLLISVMAAWGFARYNFKGNKTLFLLYIVLMIMPFQVTMVSSYLVLDAFHLMDSHYAIIIPGVFSTFPIFIMTKFFKSIPEELIESAKLDGAKRWTTFIRIGIPLGRGGIVSMVILSFLEYWNALEQPLTFLRNKTNWPLSLYLPQISSNDLGVSFIASLVMMMPALCVFLCGQTYLEQGIVASGIKQ